MYFSKQIILRIYTCTYPKLLISKKNQTLTRKFQTICCQKHGSLRNRVTYPQKLGFQTTGSTPETRRRHWYRLEQLMLQDFSRKATDRGTTGVHADLIQYALFAKFQKNVFIRLFRFGNLLLILREYYMVLNNTGIIDYICVCVYCTWGEVIRSGEVRYYNLKYYYKIIINTLVCRIVLSNSAAVE